MRAFPRGIAFGTKHNLAAAQTLADEVVSQPFKDEPHTGDSEGAEGLPGHALQFDLDGRDRFAVMQALQRELAGNARADGTIAVRDLAADEKGFAFARGGECRL
jgi:hypothetical protein